MNYILLCKVNYVGHILKNTFWWLKEMSSDDYVLNQCFGSIRIKKMLKHVEIFQDLLLVNHGLVLICGAKSPVISYLRSPVDNGLGHSWNDSPFVHYSDAIMGAMVSQITSLAIVYSNIHSGPKYLSSSHWPLCGEFTGDRWIPRTNGQWRGKCFHLMTSSWANYPTGPILLFKFRVRHTYLYI